MTRKRTGTHRQTRGEAVGEGADGLAIGYRDVVYARRQRCGQMARDPCCTLRDNTGPNGPCFISHLCSFPTHIGQTVSAEKVALVQLVVPTVMAAPGSAPVASMVRSTGVHGGAYAGVTATITGGASTTAVRSPRTINPPNVLEASKTHSTDQTESSLERNPR